MIESFKFRSARGEDLDLIESLLIAGANPNGYINDMYWQTSLLTALIKNSGNNGKDAGKLLIDYGADPNSQGLVGGAQDRAHENRSSLHKALLSLIPDSSISKRKRQRKFV